MSDTLRPLPGASGLNSVKRVEDTSGQRSADRQVTAKSAERATTAASALHAPSSAEAFGVPVPPQFAGNPEKMKTEWGWRRFLAQTFMEAENALSGEVQGMTSQELPQNTSAQLQHLVQTLWDILYPLLQGSMQSEGELPVTGWMLPGTLLSLSALTSEKLRDPTVPAKVKHAAIAEKLQSAVQISGLPIVGGGLFYPPVIAGDDRRSAVYWQAERKSFTGEEGRTVQHLFLSMRLGGDPVELLFTFSKPSLSIHIRSDNGHFRDSLTVHQGVAKESLQHMGWSMDQFSVGVLNDTEGVL